jgi:hypothetical protein
MPACFATRSGPPFAYSATVAGELTTIDFAPARTRAWAAPMFEYRGPMLTAA